MQIDSMKLLAGIFESSKLEVTFDKAL